MHWDWILKLDWNIICSAVTAISTFLMMVATGFMAVAAWRALNTWKNEQKRRKLVNLLETLNAYIQDLQYYELESTVFSKHTRQSYQENLNDNELIEKQANYIDMEIAEGFGSCILSLKNWLIDVPKQNEILNKININIQEYRIKIFTYVELKIKFFIEKNKKENILYGTNDGFLEQIYERKTDLEKTRNLLLKQIEELKEINNKLLN